MVSPSKGPLVKTTYAHKKKNGRAQEEVGSDAESSISETESPSASKLEVQETSRPRKSVTVAELPGPSPRGKNSPSKQDKIPGGSKSPPASKGGSPQGLSQKSVTKLVNGHQRPASPSDFSDLESASRNPRMTEAERKIYLESHPDVAELEPHRVLCRCCDKWLKLHPTSKYALAPWRIHKKSCTSERKSGHKARASLNGDISKDTGLGTADDDDASSIAPSASASEANGTALAAARRRPLYERKKILEEDPMTGEVKEETVYCTECSRWVKLSSRTKYELKRWAAHITKQHGRTFDWKEGSDLPSERVQEAERKMQLVNDPQVKEFSAYKVTCALCEETVTLEGKSAYQLDKWEAHKNDCLSRSSDDLTAASVTADGGMSERLLAKRSGGSPSPSRGRKRARDDDEDGTDSSRRVRTRVSSILAFEKPPSGPWGWLKLPWETFKKGFAEGLGWPEASSSTNGTVNKDKERRDQN